MTDEAIVYKYRGRRSGAHLLGVPARDLTQTDVDALPDFERGELEGHVAEGGPRDVYRLVAAEAPEETQEEPGGTVPRKGRRQPEPGEVTVVGGE